MKKKDRGTDFIPSDSQALCEKCGDLFVPCACDGPKEAACRRFCSLDCADGLGEIVDFLTELLDEIRNIG